MLQLFYYCTYQCRHICQMEKCITHSICDEQLYLQIISFLNRLVRSGLL